MRFLALLLILLTTLSHAGFYTVAFVGGGSCATTWPQTVGGSDYTVTNGQTLTLTPGQTYIYRNLTVNAGGVIECAEGNDWVVIAAVGTITVNGTIRCKKADNITGSTQFYTANLPDGTSVTRGLQTINAGGHGYPNTTTLYGNGGFGQAGTGVAIANYGENPTPTSGGRGGDGGCTITPPDLNPNEYGCYGGSGGAGGSVYGGSGSNGIIGYAGSEACSCGEHGSGGGGARGYSGGGLIIKAQGSVVIGATGIIDVSGSNGGAGGGSANGYGGGGGAGGHGGTVYFYTPILTEPVTPAILYSYGSGGAGGSGSRGNGYAGSNGYIGQALTTTIPKYCGTL